MTANEIYKDIKQYFPDNEVEVHYCNTYTREGYTEYSIMVSVSVPNSKEPRWVHSFSKTTKPQTIGDMIACLRKSLKFRAEMDEEKSFAPTKRDQRIVQQLEFEASADIKNSEFEVCLRSLLEEQLGTNKVTVERVNRYLGMSRGKMYLLLEGIGCKKEKIEQLKKLDV